MVASVRRAPATPKQWNRVEEAAAERRHSRHVQAERVRLAGGEGRQAERSCPTGATVARWLVTLRPRTRWDLLKSKANVLWDSLNQNVHALHVEPVRISSVRNFFF